MVPALLGFAIPNQINQYLIITRVLIEYRRFFFLFLSLTWNGTRSDQIFLFNPPLQIDTIKKQVTFSHLGSNMNQKVKKQCCGTVTIYYGSGSGSDF